MDKQISEAANAIAQAETLFISAGAGMGVDSGLPDFRGDEGFWRAYPLLRDENLSFQDLANPYWFREDPRRAWGFYGHRFNLYKSAKPHQGFAILKKWSERNENKAFVFTSNVDGHFQKAGFPEDSIYECHGSINYLQCSRCCTNEIWPCERLDFEIDQERLIAKGNLPTCPYCEEIARPNILMFGDASWLSKRSAAQNRLFEEWKSHNADTRVVTIELGAGKAVPTVRYTSELMTGELIRINPRDSDGHKKMISIPLGALEALIAIDNFF